MKWIGQSAAEPVKEGSTTRVLNSTSTQAGLKFCNCKLNKANKMDDYTNSILSIRDKSSNSEIKYESLGIEELCTKYSNTKKAIYKLIIDGKAISRNNTFLVRYACTTCNMQQEITLNLFMRKVNKQGKNCVSCVNKDKDKTTTHSLFMKENSTKIIKNEYKKEVNNVKSLPLKDYLELSNKDWSDESDEFRNNYFLCHLTIDEFDRIKHLIRNINKDKILDLTDWRYEPIYRIWNQTRYTPMLINTKTNIVEKPYYISFECENCGEHFCHRDLEVVKNKIKIYCQTCSFTNKIFRIRTLSLKDGTKIKWQSIQERRFIEWCNDNNISIKNGPSISYIFNDKPHEYRVDFELPELKYLIELKDNHCWYKQQVESGKQNKKEIAAKEWCSKNGYSYEILFPKNIQAFKNKIAESCKI